MGKRVVRFGDGDLVRKGRSERTVESYRDHVVAFVGVARRSATNAGAGHSEGGNKHDQVSKENGPYVANGKMRTLRAIYNHARKTDKSLPADNPLNAIDWNAEKRRDSRMRTRDLKRWFVELATRGGLPGAPNIRAEAIMLWHIMPQTRPVFDDEKCLCPPEMSC